MIVKTPAELDALVREVLMASGADERNAEIVAEHLVLANLSGVDTHSVWHLKGYVDAIADGLIIPTAWPEVLSARANSARVTGHWTFGHTAALFAMRQCLDMAEGRDMACVGLVQAHHIGRLGHYVEMAAARGMIGMVWAGGYGEEAPAAVPYGGSRSFLHTNPIAMGFPGGAGSALSFDFATSALSGVKIDNARNRGQNLPAGAIVDRNGQPSTDPADFFDGGGHLPFGGHKGYAIMLAAEFLGRIFTGADAFADPARGGPILRHQGTAFFAFKADLFQPFGDYAERADEMGQRTRAIPPAPGYAKVQMPGDPEATTRTERQREGIPIAADTWQSIVAAGQAVGVHL